MQGASPLASPGAEPGRHWNREANHAPSGGGLVSGVGGSTCRCGARWGAQGGSRPPTLPLVCFPAPIPPPPPSPPGKGEIFGLFRRGLRPRHPGIRLLTALTVPAVQVPGEREPAVRRKNDRKRLHMSNAGSQGEGGPGERNYPSHATAAFEMVLSPGAGIASAAGKSALRARAGGISFPSGHRRHPPHRAFRAIPRISRPALGNSHQKGTCQCEKILRA